ncbi:MAG: phenylalanine--tRNA ligase subunit beta [Candidatus Bipolaricaulota bacterium]
MRVSLKWLSEYVELTDVDVRELADRLTLAGLEVEDVHEFPHLEGAVVGMVRAVEAHPNADKLAVCTVEADDGEHQVVCGAPNVAPGQLVIFARPGTHLPGGVVEKAELRGVKSGGMILSRAELGLEAKSEGIWVLPEEAQPGQEFQQLIEAPDAVLDISIASNRPDLLGVHGVAREVAALLQRPLGEPALDYPERGEPAESLARVVIESAEECPRYVARLIRVVGEGVSPLWLQARLSKAGMRPLAPVVDVTNYVMLELGHPLHAFDYGRLGDSVIGVRRARPKERLTTLDGVERELTSEALLITAGDRPVAVAGVMGGEQAEVGEDTTAVLLEAACFSPARVRRSARALGLRSEASHRFERGLSPEAAERASRRCCALLAGLIGAEVSPGAADAYPEPRSPRTVSLRKARLLRVLGVEVPDDEVGRVFSSLGLSAQESDEAWQVSIPAERGDLLREIDLIEEVSRIYGYHTIPSVAPRVAPVLGAKDHREEFSDRARRSCVALGLYEVITTSLAPGDEAGVGLSNPMAQGQEGLRAWLLPGLLSVVRHTLDTQTPGVALFEIGHVFSRRAGRVEERETLGAVLVGRSPFPLSGKLSYGPEHIKGLWEQLLSALRVEGVRLGASDHSWLHPGRRGRLELAGSPVGWLGEVHPELCEDLPGRYRVQALEVDVEALMEAQVPPAHRPLPRYPVSKRDLSLVGPCDVPEERLREAILAEDLVEECFLYDIYEGERIGEGQRSLTYELTFRHSERTLASDEVEQAVKRILERLSPLGMTLRS